jgi:Glycogen debranching enzyme
VSLLGKTVRWTGDKQLANDLRPNLEQALKFIDGEVEKTGYLTYGGTGKEALANQGWKDSGDSIMHKDGKLVQGPIALAEIQGYLYSAWREAANLYDMWGDKGKSDHYNQRADALKERFNRDFWSPEDNFLALGLDGQGQRAEVISSNPGHVLSTGLLTPEHAFAVESRLMQPDMFNGYGLKTLAEGQPRHHSGSYHDGSVWPHDNSMIGEGVHDLVPGSGHTSRLIDGLFDASKHYPDNRLPELFAGYRRSEYQRPIPYPVSSIPQAWAAGSMMQLVRSNLGLHGNALTNELLVFKPSLPNSYKSLSLSGLWVGDNRVDLTFRRSGPRVLTEVVNNPGNVKVNIVEPQAGS